MKTIIFSDVEINYFKISLDILKKKKEKKGIEKNF